MFSSITITRQSKRVEYNMVLKEEVSHQKATVWRLRARFRVVQGTPRSHTHCRHDNCASHDYLNDPIVFVQNQQQN